MERVGRAFRECRLIQRQRPARLRAMGTLYYGDNLELLRRYLKDESVDLVYLDPPFNSAQNYNAFFQEKDGTAAASQIRMCPPMTVWHRHSCLCAQTRVSVLHLYVPVRESFAVHDAHRSARIAPCSG